MDLSKFSDSALQMMQSGKIDYSKLSDGELQELQNTAPAAPVEKKTSEGVPFQQESKVLGGLTRTGLRALYNRVATMGQQGVSSEDWAKARNGDAESFRDTFDRNLPKSAGPGNAFRDSAAQGLGLVADTLTDPMASVMSVYDEVPAMGSITDKIKRLLLQSRQGATQGVPTIMGMAEKPLEEAALKSTIAHLRPTAMTARGIGRDGLRDMADEVLQTGAIKPGQKIATTADNLDNLVNEVGRVKGDIVKDATGEVPIRQILQRVKKEVVDPLQETNRGDQFADPLIEEMKGFYRKYGKPGVARTPEGPLPVYKKTMTPQQLEAEKMMVDDSIDWRDVSKTPANKAQAKYANILRDEAENVITDPAFKPAKQSYGKLADASEIANRTAGLAAGGTGLFGKIDDAVVLDAMVREMQNSQPIRAATLGSIRALMKGRTTSAMAAGAQGLSKVAGNMKDSSLLDNMLREYFLPDEKGKK